jgi:hypothetical protein
MAGYSDGCWLTKTDNVDGEFIERKENLILYGVVGETFPAATVGWNLVQQEM